RRHDDHHIPQGANPNLVVPGKVTGDVTPPLGSVVFYATLPVGNQFNSGDQPTLTDITDMRMMGDPREMRFQSLDLIWQLRERLFFVEDLQGGQGRGGAQGVSAEGVSMV